MDVTLPPQGTFPTPSGTPPTLGTGLVCEVLSTCIKCAAQDFVKPRTSTFVAIMIYSAILHRQVCYIKKHTD